MFMNKIILSLEFTHQLLKRDHFDFLCVIQCLGLELRHRLHISEHIAQIFVLLG